MHRIRTYYLLAKPGIVYGNTIALVAGYFYAVIETASFDPISLAYGVVGTALVMASACVTNNIFDRDIDAHMERTKKRALVTRDISVSGASVYALVLLMVGILILSTISTCAAILGTIGWITYALIYTYLKRVTYHATLFGTIPGAIPPLIGYVAGDGQSWLWASAIFLLMLGWQMVHFYAIAIYRYDDYTNAAIPVVSRVLGVPRTLRAVEWWVFVSATSLGVLGSINALHAVLSLILLAWWLGRTNYSSTQDAALWARKVFFSSLLFLVLWLVITVMSAVMTLF